MENGETVSITREGKEIGSASPTRIHRGVRFPFRDFDWGPRPKNLETDPAQVIVDERDRERSLKKFGL